MKYKILTIAFVFSFIATSPIVKAEVVDYKVNIVSSELAMDITHSKTTFDYAPREGGYMLDIFSITNSGNIRGYVKAQVLGADEALTYDSETSSSMYDLDTNKYQVKTMNNEDTRSGYIVLSTSEAKNVDEGVSPYLSAGSTQEYATRIYIGPKTPVGEYNIKVKYILDSLD